MQNGRARPGRSDSTDRASGEPGAIQIVTIRHSMLLQLGPPLHAEETGWFKKGAMANAQCSDPTLQKRCEAREGVLDARPRTVQSAMDVDLLTTSRSFRQPIEAPAQNCVDGLAGARECVLTIRRSADQSHVVPGLYGCAIDGHRRGSTRIRRLRRTRREAKLEEGRWRLRAPLQRGDERREELDLFASANVAKRSACDPGEGVLDGQSFRHGDRSDRDILGIYADRNRSIRAGRSEAKPDRATRSNVRILRLAVREI
ncbi:hypothetical protein MYXO_01781 [Myxococcaceae bacterium]|nr:hypothetical protein MYXO_01781 [Myxococcaceae bacterium]